MRKKVSEKKGVGHLFGRIGSFRDSDWFFEGDREAAWSIPGQTFAPSIRPSFRYQKGRLVAYSSRFGFVLFRKTPFAPIRPSSSDEEWAKRLASIDTLTFVDSSEISYPTPIAQDYCKAVL
tara:strand:- start:85 stop:447 length:363 start_codon:yes stop_codon:yes gene_type:complete